MTGWCCRPRTEGVRETRQVCQFPEPREWGSFPGRRKAKQKAGEGDSDLQSLGEPETISLARAGASLCPPQPLPSSRPLPPGKLTGMNEITEKLTLPDTCRSDHVVVQKVTATANLGRVPCGTSDEYRCEWRGRGGLRWGLA